MSVKVNGENVIVNSSELQELARKLLEAVNVPPEDAAIAAEVMVDTNLKGVESHGVRWLDIYLKRIQSGCVKPITALKTIKEKAGLLLLDAQGGLGQVAMSKGIDMGIAKAKTAGICAVAIRNSNHFGACGYYTAKAAEADMAALVMTNGTPLMAPWGGITPCIGTNPFSYGFPGPKHPVVLDMATTATARGKVFLAAQKGYDLPAGMALNKEGEPTVNPKEALEGILLPVGGPKGYGLSLIIDILAGIVTGSNHGQNITSLYGDLEHMQNIGHFAVIINLEDFISLDDYMKEMEQSRKEIKSSKLAKGCQEVFVPGEIEANKYNQSIKEGITLPTATWNTLQDWAKRLNLQ
ncbi:Ldh family oxidoreductase [Sporomusa acidovorans]|uniref:Oxidoreductase YjmC n=1 Tax=Sporomusa acidovorans (strain ATCC 49682 / DSM 3132 / Mol) TaxID=1123286 RepID=A0ABZ3J7R2_SPOA4|nr:Ldh family oxidoreductase [Sporomusa acidovorans]OZC16706.1 putative oxidoreductase YjmC [Sporomusa acidovorans DSM 3132]SDE05228.1 Malate/lactate/ureidoglycolate dehydrogenase, LDH2 family [Sporomusa acidovorans]